MDQHETALLEAISESPDDDRPRLAYAEWLDLHSERGRAEFIRCQLRQPGRPKLSPNWVVTDRQGQLLKEHCDDWLSGLVQSYSGGFAEHVYVSIRDYPIHEPTWRRLAPTCIAELKPRGMSEGDKPAKKMDYEALASCASLSGWKHLMSYEPRVDPSGFLALLASPYLTRVQFLDVEDVKLGGRIAKGLAPLQCLAGLERLILNNSYLADDDICTLVEAGQLGGLKKLVLSSNEISDAGAAAVANSRFMANLEWIELSGNKIGDVGAMALSKSPYLGDLKWLFLDDQEATLGKEATQSLRDRFGDALSL